MQVELAGRRRRRRTLLPSAAASGQTPSPTCIHTDRTTKYALRVLGRAKRVYVSPSYPKDSWVLLLLILVVSSADAQLSLSLGQHNTDQADVVRGLIKISAHISIHYISRTEFCSANNTIYPPHPHPGFSAFSAEVQIPNLT